MTSKKLLKFYFCADRLNDALDNLIVHSACASGYGPHSFSHYADRVIELVSAKSSLSELWRYLNGIMLTFSGEDKGVLYGYAFMRGGYSALPPERAKSIRRVVVRFMRRAKGLSRYGEALSVLSKYYALAGGHP